MGYRYATDERSVAQAQAQLYEHINTNIIFFFFFVLMYKLQSTEDSSTWLVVRIRSADDGHSSIQQGAGNHCNQRRIVKQQQSAMMKTDAGTCASLSVSLLTTSSRLSTIYSDRSPVPVISAVQSNITF